MKYLIKQLFAIILVWLLLAVVFSASLHWNNWQSWGQTVAWTFLALLLVRPIYQIITLPINLITFGLFRPLFYIAMIAVIDQLVPGWQIQAINLNQLNQYLSPLGISLPQMVFVGWGAYFLLSMIFYFCHQILSWVIN